MTTAWFHCFAGTAGDMTMAALVAAGADPLEVVQIVGALPLDGYALTFERVQRCGVGATQALVGVHEHDDGHAPHRPYAHIRAVLDTADLPARVRERAHRVFRALAEVEAAIHGTSVDEVEFHEVGSVDAIVDVVGACAALEVLGVDRIVCSPISVGTGTVRAAHGVLPNPAPAVVALLAGRGAPSVGVAEPMELATPTGVALMTALADEFGPMPAFQVSAVGYGAGSRDTPGRPNVVQVVLGTEPPTAVAAGGAQPVQLFETNVDDATGEVIAHTIAALLSAGAHDAWATPIVMKKGRPAHTVHALCDPSLGAAISALLLRETGSLGVRGALLQRWPQQRDERTVMVDGHAIAVKVAAGRVKVEHDDASRAAAALGLPLREVLRRAAEAAHQ